MEYRPLDIGKNEIRLLKVLPCQRHKPVQRSNGELRSNSEGQAEELIQCTLEHVSLHDYTEKSQAYMAKSGLQNLRSSEVMRRHYSANLLDGCTNLGTDDDSVSSEVLNQDTARMDDFHSIPHYPRWKWGDFVALSYHWGSQEDCREIEVNGQRAQVTRNLHEFLQAVPRRLAFSGCVTGIWIDALCINQQNIKERNAQVHRMTDIYYLAQFTIVWLGREADSSGLAMMGMRVIADQEAGEEIEVSIPQILQELGVKLPVLLDAITSLLTRPYWRRLWIIQEMAWSSQAIVACGDRAMNLNVLSLAVSKLHGLYQNPMRKRFGLSASGASGLRRLALLCEFRDCYSDAGAIYSSTEVLRFVRDAEQADAKDKIYGIMSLLSPVLRGRILVDYDLSIKQVYFRFAIARIAESQRLHILCEARCSRLGYMGWPSWLLDLRQVPTVKAEIRFHTNCHASGNKCMEVETESGQYLRVKGMSIDTVDGLGFDPSSFKYTFPTGPLDHTGVNENANAFRGGSLHLIQPTEPSLKCPYDGEKGFQTALWNTLVAGRSGVSKPVPLHFESILHLLWSLYPELENLPEAVKHYAFDLMRQGTYDFQLGGKAFGEYYAPPKTGYTKPSKEESLIVETGAFNSLYGRRLLVTGKGYLGLAPHTSQKGDVIALLFGCSVPMIMRPLENGSWRLVGEAYVHGIMNGEALNWIGKEGCEQTTFNIC